METYRKLLIVELKLLGASEEWAEVAVNKIDLQHYWRKHFVSELAELIMAHRNRLDYLA